MRGKKLRIFVAIALAVLTATALAGCGEPEPTVAPDEPAYAGAIAESLLQALINTENYTVFSENFDEAMKKAMTEDSFKKTHNDLRGNYGEYVSKEYISTEENVQDIYTAVTYKAIFSKRSAGLMVRVVFLETDDRVYVSGLWFQ